MLHPSPQDSQALIPAMEVFSDHCTCIAFDTPGYGLSDDIDADIPVIDDYVKPFAEALTLLGVNNFAVYGVATGAQLAISLGKALPERVSLALLDTNGHLSDEEKNVVLEGYMPDTSANRSGGHLLTYWDMVRSLFQSFPWQAGGSSNRIHMDRPPADVLHAVFLRYLNAGEGYARAYKAAFDTEHIDHLQGLTVPTSIMRWQGSIVLPWTEALIDFPLTDNITILEAGKPIEDRFNAQLEYIKKQYLKGDTLSKITSVDASHCVKSYLGNVNKLHCRQNLTGNGDPVILFHDLGESSQQLRDLGEKLAGKRPFTIVDLPGHSASLDVTENTFESLDSYVRCIEDAIRTTNFERADLVGVGFGGLIAAELSDKLENTKATVIDPVNLSETQSLSLEPSADGAHLVRAWNKVFNSELYKPWYLSTSEAILSEDADLSPTNLHLKTHDLLILGNRYDSLMALQIDYPWQDKVKTLKQSPRFARTNNQSLVSEKLLFRNTNNDIVLDVSKRNEWVVHLGLV